MDTQISRTTADVDNVSACYEAALCAVFRKLLLREPSPAGLADLTRQLRNGRKFDEILDACLRSAEFKEKHPAVLLEYFTSAQQHESQDRGATATAQIEWFHSFDLGDGQVICGKRPLEQLRVEAESIFSEPVAGKTVLDIGAWDGYFSFEAERRGAADVLATDHFCWSGPGWGTKAGFDYVHGKLGSRVRALDIDVFELDSAALGTFDVSLFLGVLYHLKDPFGGLERLYRVTRDMAVIETEVTELGNPAPVLRFYEGRELNNDSTNFFVPNHACLEAMLREVGFRRFKFTPRQHQTSLKRGRTIVHAWK